MRLEDEFSDVDQTGDDAPWSEPEIIHDLVIDGVSLSRSPSGGIRAVAWQHVSGCDGVITERRIVIRASLPYCALLKVHFSFRLLWPSFAHLWPGKWRH